MTLSLPSPDLWLLLGSALLVALGFGLLRRRCNRNGAFVMAIVLMLYWLLTALFVIVQQLTGKGIDTSVVYHLQTGLDGSGWREFLPLITGAIAGIVLSLVLAWLLRRHLLKPGQDGTSLSMVQTGVRRHLRPALAGVLMLGAWGLHPGSQDLARLGLNSFGWTEPQQDELFTQIDAKSLPLAKAPRDLVWIYLESVERTYLDDARFPGLTPALQALSQQALRFDALQQTEGAGWTIAGMVASQCGAPLLTLLHGNALTGADRFMSNATCLGDVLSAQGYQLDYMGGASLQFAGKGAFYRTHGFTPAGLEELSPRMPAGTGSSNWGLYDDMLYEQAWQTLMQKVQQPAPLGLVMLTLDTHHPKGHATPACRQLRYRDGQNGMLNAVHCADLLVGRFVQRLREHPRLKDALIVISSDHLAMPNDASVWLDKGPRHNLLLLLHPELQAGSHTRAGTTLDTAPTVLTHLGIDTPALGYGRNLTDTAPTLFQSKAGQLDAYLLRQQRFLTGLWRYPDLRNGLQAVGDQVEIEGRRLRTPILLALDAQHKVTSVSYPAGTLLPTLLLDMPEDQAFVWVDRCGLIMPLNGQTPAPQAHDLRCAAVGQVGQTWHVWSLPDGQRLTARQIREQVRHASTVAHDPRMQASKRQNWQRWTSLQVAQTPPLPGLRSTLAIVSSGHLEQPSQVLEQPDLQFVRGLTLLRIDPEGQAQKIAHRDTCAGEHDQPMKDKIALLQPANLRTRPPAGHVHVLIAHDSAVCGPSTLSALFEGSALDQAATLELRQPYIGVITDEGDVYEFSAPAEQTLTAVLQPKDPA